MENNNEETKEYILLTDFVDKELETISKKNKREYNALKNEIAQLEQSGDYYPGVSERQFKGIKTKYYRILYVIEGEFIICLVLAKKQGQKLENYHYDLAAKRYKEVKRQLKEFKTKTK